MKKYNDKEIWKIVKNSKYKIKVSNHGRFEMPFNITYGRMDDGYLKISYENFNGDRIGRMAHRIVAEYFIPLNKNINSIICHIDNNKINNHYTNLKWISIKDNNVKLYGLSVAQYTLSGKFVKLFKSINEAERECKISSSVIANVLSGCGFSAGNFLWIKKYDHDNFPEIIKEKVNLYNNKSKGGRHKIDYSVYKIDKNTNEILEKIDSIVKYVETSREREAIRRCCSDKRIKSVGGYRWEFVKEDSNV